MIPQRTLAAIHIARRSAALDDADYRAMLRRTAGVDSATKLDPPGAGRVLDELTRLGARPAAITTRRPRATQPLARKARAIWLMLFNLDELETGSEKALAAFTRRVTGKDDMAFCDGGELNRVVEALKAWSLRAGVSADTTEALLAPHRALLAEQWRRLGGLPEFSAHGAGDLGLRTFLTTRGVDVGAFDRWSDADLNAIANGLGRLLRTHRLGNRHKEVS